MLLTAFLAALLSAGSGDGASRLAVIRQAADFTLTTQDEKSLKLADLRGKVLLVSFIFTTCNGSCPATTHRMSQAAQALEKEGLFKDDQVRLLSITLDPKRAPPEALRRYMHLDDLDATHSNFRTGPTAQVEKVIAAWGMWVKEAPQGQLDHPSRVFLLDGGGRVREVYNLEYFKPAWVLEDVKLLLKESGSKKNATRREGSGQ